MAREEQEERCCHVDLTEEEVTSLIYLVDKERLRLLDSPLPQALTKEVARLRNLKHRLHESV